MNFSLMLCLDFYCLVGLCLDFFCCVQTLIIQTFLCFVQTYYSMLIIFMVFFYQNLEWSLKSTYHIIMICIVIIYVLVNCMEYFPTRFFIKPTNMCDNHQFSVKSKSNKVNKSNRSTQLTLLYQGLHYVTTVQTRYFNKKLSLVKFICLEFLNPNMGK